MILRPPFEKLPCCAYLDLSSYSEGPVLVEKQRANS